MSDPGSAAPGWPSPPPARATRLLPTLVWEAVLVLVVAVLAVAVLLRTEAFGHANLLYSFAALGLLASGLALSLRTGTPNLAVAAFAGLAGVLYAELRTSDWPAPAAAFVAVALVGVLGLLLGLLVGATSLPAWAVSLAGLAVASSVALALGDGRPVVIPGQGAPGMAAGVGYALLFVVISVGGALLCLVPAVRRVLGGDAAADPLRWNPQRLVAASVGFLGSSLLAGLSGLVTVSLLRGSVGGMDATGRLALAFAAVALGGLSVRRWRGGIAGTVLGTGVLVLANLLLLHASAPIWLPYWLLPAAVIVVGLLVGRLLDQLSGSDPAAAPHAPPHAVPHAVP